MPCTIQFTEFAERSPSSHVPSPLFFQIGFSRCGTTLIAAFFSRSGIPAVHADSGRLSLRIRENLSADPPSPPLAGYEQYQAFTNMCLITERDCYDGFKQYPALLAHYGGQARFILNTRPLEHWIRSMKMHPSCLKWPQHVLQSHFEWRYGTADKHVVEEYWREDWATHHARVREEIPSEQLLVFDIESDSPEKLCAFAELPSSCARFYRREDPTLSQTGRRIAKCVPQTINRALPRPLHRALNNLLRARSDRAYAKRIRDK